MTIVQIEKYFLDEIRKALLGSEFIEGVPNKQAPSCYRLEVQDARTFLFRGIFHMTSQASKAKNLLRKKLPTYRLKTHKQPFMLTIQPSADAIQKKRQEQVAHQKNEELFLQSTAQENQTDALKKQMIEVNLKKIESFISSSNLRGRGVIVGISDFQSALIEGILSLEFNRSENAQSHKEAFFNTVGLLPTVQESSWTIDLTVPPVLSKEVPVVEIKKEVVTSQAPVPKSTPTPAPSVAVNFGNSSTSSKLTTNDWMKARRTKLSKMIKKAGLNMSISVNDGDFLKRFYVGAPSVGELSQIKNYFDTQTIKYFQGRKPEAKYIRIDPLTIPITEEEVKEIMTTTTSRKKESGLRKESPVSKPVTKITPKVTDQQAKPIGDSKVVSSTPVLASLESDSIFKTLSDAMKGIGGAEKEQVENILSALLQMIKTPAKKGDDKEMLSAAVKLLSHQVLFIKKPTTEDFVVNMVDVGLDTGKLTATIKTSSLPQYTLQEILAML